MYLLLLASVLTQMLLDIILLDIIILNLWENYRKLAMALHSKPDIDMTSQIQIIQSTILINVFLLYFSIFTLL